MKNTLILLLVVSILCSCKSQNNDVEDILYSCIENFYNIENNNLEKDLNDFENILLANNVIESVDGDGYYNCLKNIKNDDEKILNLDLAQFKKLEIFVVNPNLWIDDQCKNEIKKIDTIRFLNSKFYLLQKELKNNANYFSGAEGVLKNITNVLESSDFEIPYYRAISLFAIFSINYNSINLNLGLKKNVVKINKEGLKSTKIYLEKESIYLNDKLITLEELNKQVESFIELYKEKHLILLTSNDNAKYELYFKTENELRNIYEKLRNRLSQKLYYKNYEELNEIEKDEIKKVYPMNIDENSI